MTGRRRWATRVSMPPGLNTPGASRASSSTVPRLRVRPAWIGGLETIRSKGPLTAVTPRFRAPRVPPGTLRAAAAREIASASSRTALRRSGPASSRAAAATGPVPAPKSRIRAPAGSRRQAVDQQCGGRVETAAGEHARDRTPSSRPPAPQSTGARISQLSRPSGRGGGEAPRRDEHPAVALDQGRARTGPVPGGKVPARPSESLHRSRRTGGLGRRRRRGPPPRAGAWQLRSADRGMRTHASSKRSGWRPRRAEMAGHV